jgi:hypothetical protein
MSAKDLADTIQAAVTAAALLIGGGFTYLKFVKDRVYRPRLDLIIDAEYLQIAGEECLRCTVAAHNIGTGRIQIKREGTALSIIPGDPHSERLRKARWLEAERANFKVFALHDWIEAGETIHDETLLTLGTPRPPAARAELQIMVHDPTPWKNKPIQINTARVLTTSTSTATGRRFDMTNRDDERNRPRQPSEGETHRSGGPGNSRDKADRDPAAPEPMGQSYEDPERTEDLERDKQ